MDAASFVRRPSPAQLRRLARLQMRAAKYNAGLADQSGCFDSSLCWTQAALRARAAAAQGGFKLAAAALVPGRARPPRPAPHRALCAEPPLKPKQPGATALAVTLGRVCITLPPTLPKPPAGDHDVLLRAPK